MSQIEVECPECKKAMNFKQLGSEAHVQSCVAGESVCPLDCGKQVASIEEGLDHWEHDCPHTMVVCQWCKKGIQRMSMFLHSDKCTKFPVNCTLPGCNKKVPRKFLQRHVKECDYAKTTCEECNKEMLIKDLSLHKQTCIETLVYCDNNCGFQVKKKE